jgi:glycosyl transferase family 25
MNKIDKFLYINLDKRTDRNEHIIKELERFHVPKDKIIRLPAFESQKGAYGCAMSHMKAMELFKESNDKIWCILEDDHYFTQSYEETNELINNFIENENYDTMLGCYCNVRGNNLNDGIFRRITQSSMTSFYIVKKNVCDALIASNKQSARTLNPRYGMKGGTPCDFMWNHLMKVFVFVAPHKPFGSQIIDYSDIRKKVMNYSTFVGLKVNRSLKK